MANRTLKQIEAARRNGAKSKGPSTPEGKKASAQNALKHGLAASPEIVINAEPDNYTQLLESYVDTYNPQGAAEYDLVCQLVAASLRLRRIGRIEANLIETEMLSRARILDVDGKLYNDEILEALAFRALASGGRSLDLLLRYTNTARRAYDAALKSLRDLQRERLKVNSQNEPGNPKAPKKSEACKAANAEQQSNPRQPAAILPFPEPRNQPPANQPQQPPEQAPSNEGQC